MMLRTAWRAETFQILAISLLILLPCSGWAKPAIVTTGQDEYMIAQSDKGGIFGNASKMKTKVLRQADEFAKSRQKILVPISLTEVPMAPGRFATIEYRFRLVDPPPTLPKSADTNDKIPGTEAEAIEYYFADRNLSLVEGVWTSDTNRYQVAIISNDKGVLDQYDFLGVIIRAESKSWHPGDVKLLLNSTASPTVFTGIYFDEGRVRRNLSYLFEDENLIRVNQTVDNAQPMLIRDYPTGLSGGPDKASTQLSQGTCFAVGPKGTIVTSNHVVDGASKISVTLADGEQADATLEASSTANDIAILRINRDTPNYLTFASTRSRHIGDQVFTIGFPSMNVLGNEPKFTEGSISALSGIQGDASYMQISVPIQPGNSGGPVVNFNGEVLGVVAATAAVQTFFKATGSLPQNVNWAVKSDYVKPMLDDVSVGTKTSNRSDAIAKVKGAVCQVLASQ